MGSWSKSRILFLIVGVVLVVIGAWLILPSLAG
jgi:uncharacterized membrane protein